MSEEPQAEVIQRESEQSDTPSESVGATESLEPSVSLDTPDTDKVPNQEADIVDKTPADETPPAEPEPVEMIETSRYKELQAEYTRNRQADKVRDAEMGELRQQLDTFKGVDPQAVAAYKQQQELPVWNPSSPKYQSFMAAQERLKVINSLSISPEDKQAEASRHLTDVEMKEQISWGEHQRSEQQQMMQDPQNYINRLVESRVQETIQAQLNGFNSTQKTQTHIKRMFDDPAFKSMYLSEDTSTVSEAGDQLNKLLAQGVPFEVADSMLRSQRDLQTTKSENIELRRQTAATTERERLLRDGATESREVRAAGGSVYDEAKAIAAQRGIRLDSDAGLKLLQALESKTVS